MSRKALILLENAWSPLYASLGRPWPRESWLRALHASRTGQRLQRMTNRATDWTFVYDNTSPKVMPLSGRKTPIDIEHVRGVLAAEKPDAVVACGRTAQRALQLAVPIERRIPCLWLPHPASRGVTDAIFIEAALQLTMGLVNASCAVELIQARGKMVIRYTQEWLTPGTGLRPSGS